MLSNIAKKISHLSILERQRFIKKGWLVPDFIIRKEELDNLNMELDKLIKGNPNRRPEFLVQAHLTKSKEGTEGSTKFMKLAKSSNVLDLVESVIGPNILLWGCHIFCKPTISITLKKKE